MATETVKQKILQVVERLPDTVTLENAIERLFFLLGFKLLTQRGDY
jgi:hypothetical protein